MYLTPQVPLGHILLSHRLVRQDRQREPKRGLLKGVQFKDQ